MITGLGVVDVRGAPREMGRAHGEAMRDAIARGIDAWLAVIGSQVRMAPADYVRGFLETTGFTPAIEDFTPHLLEEVRGIAEGANQPFATILAYQMMDEEWAHRVAVARARRGESCSAAGVLREDGTAVIGQNMDLPSHYDGTQVVLRARPDQGNDVIVFTPAGMIGTTGLNERGVGVCVNALFELSHRPSGLPVSFVVRGVLAQSRARDAAALLKTAAHATGQNYLVGDPTRVEDYECSPGEVAEVHARGAALLHTNHPLMSTDVDPEARPERGSNSVARLERLREGLGDLGHRVTAKDLMRVLSDRSVPVCVPRGSEWMTLGSVVMELGPEPVMHAALGPPADTAYSEVRF